jgi:hypothetical protein
VHDVLSGRIEHPLVDEGVRQQFQSFGRTPMDRAQGLRIPDNACIQFRHVEGMTRSTVRLLDPRGRAVEVVYG